MNPFKIEGPALISFSGGRTSGYMLHEIVRAHNNSLPADIHVCFANTGKEREETLRFVYECGLRWDVDVVWLEYRSVDGKHTFERVGYNSASRSGEPFEAVIAARGFLPNGQSRFCTTELKIHTMARYGRWAVAISASSIEPSQSSSAGPSARPTHSFRSSITTSTPKGERRLSNPVSLMICQWR